MRATSTSPIFQCLMCSVAIAPLRVKSGRCRARPCLSWHGPGAGLDVSSNGRGAAMPSIMSAAFSATITTAAFVLPPTMRGNIDASTTRKPATPVHAKLWIDHGVRRPSPCGNC